jgi:hypothetical protein
LAASVPREEKLSVSGQLFPVVVTASMGCEIKATFDSGGFVYEREREDGDDEEEDDG